MAWSNTGSTRNTNAVPGFLTSIGESSIYDVDATAKFAIGTGFKRADGTLFRYGNFISACTQGKLVAHVSADVDNLAATSIVTVGTSATQQAGDIVGVYPSLIGSRYVLVVVASVVAKQWEGGYLTVTRGTGVGYQYRIIGNTASATVNSVANTVIVQLDAPLVVSLDANSYVSIIGSLFTDLATASVATNYIVMGATVANMTAGSYGWIVVDGPAVVLQDGTVANGQEVSLGYVTAGAVVVASGSAVQTVGRMIDQGGNTYYSNVYLQLE